MDTTTEAATQACPMTCTLDCTVCQEHAESLDPRGICAECVPVSRQCECCDAWLHRDVVNRASCGHLRCQECEYSERGIGCSACWEERRS